MSRFDQYTKHLATDRVCPRCRIGIDDDGDGNCKECAGVTGTKAQRLFNLIGARAEAVAGLLAAVKIFAPTEETLSAFADLARDDDGPRVYGHTVNLTDNRYTDHDCIALDKAIKEVRKIHNFKEVV